MKKGFFLLIAVVLFGVVSSHAQENTLKEMTVDETLRSGPASSSLLKSYSSREAYQKWRKEVLVSNNQPHFYLAVTTSRVKNQIALIKFGVAGYSTEFGAVIKQLKLTKSIDGEETGIELGEPSKFMTRALIVSQTVPKENFADATIALDVDDQANAFEVSFTLEGEQQERKLVVPLKDIPLTETLTIVK